VKKTLIYSALTMVVGALVATTLDVERFERRQPGEGRRESRTRYSKVGNAGDESVEARIRDESFADSANGAGRRPPRGIQRGLRVPQWPPGFGRLLE